MIKRIVQRHGLYRSSLDSRYERIKKHSKSNPTDKVAKKVFQKLGDIKRFIGGIDKSLSSGALKEKETIHED